MLLVLLSGPAMADTRQQILVVGGASTPAHGEVIGAMTGALGESGNRRFQLRSLASGDYTRAQVADAGMVLTVGAEAAAAVLRDPPAVPVYCTFLPEATYAALPTPAGGVQRSALFVDQSYTRRMRLIRQALPNKNRLGVVLGPESRRDEQALRRAASAEGFRLDIEIIAEERQLVGALHRAMDDADLLFAVPDAMIFNRHTAQNILLTAYRLGKPVTGFSRAYVTAGALFSVHSTPALIGREIGETLLAMPKVFVLPPSHHSKYFEVETNERVARSLGITLEGAAELTRRLHQVAAETPQ